VTLQNFTLGTFAQGAAGGGAAFESIATVTVGSGGASSVTFSSIPSTYQHLQIRGIARNATSNSFFYMRINSDTGSNYAYHRLTGSGSAASASGTASDTGLFQFGRLPNAADVVGAAIYDILDYKSTSKYKTVRGFQGYEDNSGGSINLVSGLWQSTSAITTIELTPNVGITFAQYTQFALYGIKGA
jgi:hypothetical protein